MNGRTKLNEVLALVDMTKVNLPSYNIAVGKYDAIANAYTKIIFLSAVATLGNETGDAGEDEKLSAVAKKTIIELIENPKRYYYEEAVAKEKELTEKVAYDYWGSKSENDPKVRKVIAQARKQRMIQLMNEMLSSLHTAEKNYSDEVLDALMDDAVFERTMARFTLPYDAVSNPEKSDETSSSEAETPHIITDESIDDVGNIEEPAVRTCEQPVSFWGKVKSFFRK